MGGQETLLLVARHPRLLAGAAAFDPVVDLSLQYHEFPHLGCSKSCRKLWNGPVGRSLQALARAELGGSPRRARYAYELRSPLTYARAIAFSHVPLQLWWSKQDAIVIDQQRQTARLFNSISKLNPRADLIGFTGGWRHSAEMHAKTRLPLSLALFALLPPRYARMSGLVVKSPPTPPAGGHRAQAPRREVRLGEERQAQLAAEAMPAVDLRLELAFELAERPWESADSVVFGEPLASRCSCAPPGGTARPRRARRRGRPAAGAPRWPARPRRPGQSNP